MEEVKLNSHGVNKLIKAHLLSEKEMREIGFSDFCKDTWYFYRYFKPIKKIDFEVGFSVSINKKDPLDLRIDVLDEDYCQPYDYQSMLENNPTFAPALKVQKFVEECMAYLRNKGVLSGHIEGEYI